MIEALIDKVFDFVERCNWLIRRRSVRLPVRVITEK